MSGPVLRRCSHVWPIDKILTTRLCLFVAPLLQSAELWPEVGDGVKG